MTDEVVVPAPDQGDLLHGGFTLIDLFAAICGGWAIPFAVMSSLGFSSGWRFPAYVAGSVLGLFWAWWCKVIEWHIHTWRLSRESGGPSRPTTAASVVVTLCVVAAGVLVPYGLYRAIRLVLGIAVHGA